MPPRGCIQYNVIIIIIIILIRRPKFDTINVVNLNYRLTVRAKDRINNKTNTSYTARRAYIIIMDVRGQEGQSWKQETQQTNERDETIGNFTKF